MRLENGLKIIYKRIATISKKRNKTATITVVLKIKLNLAIPLPLNFSGFFLIFDKLIAPKIIPNRNPIPVINPNKVNMKLSILKGS